MLLKQLSCVTRKLSQPKPSSVRVYVLLNCIHKLLLLNSVFVVKNMSISSKGAIKWLGRLEKPRTIEPLILEVYGEAAWYLSLNSIVPSGLVQLQIEPGTEVPGYYRSSLSG